MADLIINPNTAPTKADLTQKTDGSLDLANFVGEILPSTDPVLLSLGGNIKEYQKLRRDDQVKALLQQRQDKLVESEWEVVAGGEEARDIEAADFLRQQLHNISFDGVSRKMHGGILYGYSIAECLYGSDAGRITLQGIRVRAPWRFGFAKDGTLKLKVQTEYRLMPPRKFWITTWDAEDDDSPYGCGLGHTLWWPVYLKRNGARFWAAYLDRFGIPTTKAVYPEGGSDSELEKRKRTALEAAQALRSEGAIAMPQGFDVSLIESTSKGAGDFASFLAYWDDAIAKIILSQTSTSRIGQYTGTASVHASVSYSVIKADADLLCESFNAGPAVWLTEWNFPGAKIPRVWRKVEDPDRLKDEAERDKFTRELGLQLSDTEIERRYGDAWERQNAGVAPLAPIAPNASGQDPAFAEQEVSTSESLAAQLESLADAPSTAMIDTIRQELDEAIASGEDISSFAERLLSTGKLTGFDDMAALLSGALLTANLAGQAGEE